MTTPLDNELFDPHVFDAQIAETSNHIPIFRSAVKHARSILIERFQAGRSATELVLVWARVIDEFLLRAWQQAIPVTNDDIALLAAGGYGRGELHPHSDIDILILLEQNTEHYNDAITGFLTFLWDIGLEIGHGVRSLSECVEEAKKDITVATNLQESRLLAGPVHLFEQQRDQCGPDFIWPSREFFAAKWQEQLKRHQKFNDTAYNLEPNIKEGPGGLRDIQMIGWVAKRHFGADTLADLVQKEFITEQEYKSLLEGQAFLWQIRFGLHVLSGRREDRLLFDHQRSLAKQFGYRDEPHRLGVERFMKRYYRTIMELSRLNEMLLQLFQEEILYAEESESPVAINKRFQIHKGFLEVRQDNTFKFYPFALLELFLILAQRDDIKGIRANTIRLIRDHRYLIDGDFRDDLRCRSLFMEILRQPKGITYVLRRMNLYGILAAYIPLFGNIVGQMQHDLFHVYTVDEHTLFVIRNLRRFTVPEFRHEFPLCSEIIETLPKQELLLLAGLFHDIAKGRGGDHSTLGAEDALQFCLKHGLSLYDARLVSWLVKNHLLMSTTAQRKDISAPEIIHEFAHSVSSQSHLKYLYLLTVADIRATSPAVWNDWKDSLLKDLYNKTMRALRRGLDNPLIQSEYIQEVQEQARQQLLQLGHPDSNITKHWQTSGEEYFLRYAVDEIVWHADKLMEKNVQLPFILMRQQSHRGGAEVFIYAKVTDRLFSLTTSVIEQMGMTIVDARILTSQDGLSLDTFIILEEDGSPIENLRFGELKQKLIDILTHEADISIDVNRRLDRQAKHFKFPTRIEFWQDAHQERTAMQVIAFDRPGLLSLIGTAMDHCNVLLQNAKIATFGERAEDIFYITDRNNAPIQDPLTLQCLEHTITEFLDD